MRGRILDPKLGRFLTMDPVVSKPWSGQSWNPYSYTANNPLSFVDPSGFSEEPLEKPGLLPRPNTQRGPDGALEIVVIGRKKEPTGPREAADVGAGAPPTDVDTTGSSAGYDAQPGTTTPEDWTQHSLVQVEGGFIAGLALGRVPFGSVVAGAIAGPGSRWAEIGRGVGEIVGGGFAFAAGMAGMLGGGAASGTGVGTVPGVLAVAGSAALVAGGIANVMTGAGRLGQALSMSSGSGSSGPNAAAPVAAGGAKATAGQGFHSFPAFKRAMGPAGPGKNWHHVVEQTPANVAKFGPESLHNTQNVIRIETDIHRRISGYYSSKMPGTNMTIRQWLSTQSFDTQREFGMEVLRNFGGIP
jgi:hypothetical protein